MDNDIPTRFVTDRLVTSIKTQNPGYEYKFWNRRKVEELFKNPDFNKYYQLYQSMRFHIEKCDYVRYLILYLFGGIYVDLDFHSQTSFDSILSREIALTEDPPSMVFLPWKGEKAVFNGFLASKPKHHFWINLLDYILYTYSPNKTVFDNTGPIALGRLATKLNLYENTVYDKYFVNMCVIRPIVGSGEFNPRSCDQIKAIGNYEAGANSNWFNTDVLPSFCVYMADKFSFWIILLLLIIIVILIVIIFAKK